MVNQRPNILIFRDHLLNRSETFIRAQAQALRYFEPYYAGSRKVDELPLPARRTITINKFGPKGKFAEIPFKLFGFAPLFLRRIRAIEPVLIHAHFGPDGVLALPIARALQVPLIVTFHGYDATVNRESIPYPFYHSHRIYFRKEALLKRDATLFIAVSEFIKCRLLARGFPPGRIVVHYIGVDTQALQPDAEMPRQPIVLFVGRLVEVKGCKYLIQAMKEVQAQVRGAQLVIVGDGPLRPDLEKLALVEAITDCHFVGWQSHQDVRQWLNKAQVYCAPSVVAASGAEEGLWQGGLEAQAMGVPVVSFSTGGIPEAISHGATGFLAAEKNTTQLAAYIIQLLKDNDLWNKLSQAAQHRMRTHFDLYRQTEKLEGIYRSVIDSSRAAGRGHNR